MRRVQPSRKRKACSSEIVRHSIGCMQSLNGFGTQAEHLHACMTNQILLCTPRQQLSSWWYPRDGLHMRTLSGLPPFAQRPDTCLQKQLLTQMCIVCNDVVPQKPTARACCHAALQRKHPPYTGNMAQRACRPCALNQCSASRQARWLAVHAAYLCVI